jgi:hypothetical protein
MIHALEGCCFFHLFLFRFSRFSVFCSFSVLRANRANDVLCSMTLTRFAATLFLRFSQLVYSKDAVPTVGPAACLSITRNSFHFLFSSFSMWNEVSRLRRLMESIFKILANLFAVSERGVVRNMNQP